MKKEKTRWFGIPKLFPYLKGYGRLVLADMIALGFIGSAMMRSFHCSSSMPSTILLRTGRSRGSARLRRFIFWS